MAMGWTDSHLHEFRIGQKRFGKSDPEDELMDLPALSDENTAHLFMVLGKAPQTGPVESFTRSGVGGHFAPELKWAGYDAVIVQGKASKPVYLWITDQKAEILEKLKSVLMSLDLGDEGIAAVRRLFSEAESRGIIPASDRPLLAGE
jgi:hypothetical protein